MSSLLQDARLRFVGLHYETSLYELHGPQLTNRYYVLSGSGTRQLMAYPEVVGFDSYQAMLPATLKNSLTPYMLPWSVMARAGIPSWDARLNSFEMAEKPSRIEYWVWT